MIVYSDLTYKTATSYISVLEFRNIVSSDYFLKDKVLPEDDTEIELLLEMSTSIFDNSFNFRSTKLRIDQKLEFPRTDFEDYISDNIKKFISYTAIQLLEDSSVYINRVEESEVKKEKLDVLEVEYFQKTKVSSWTNKLNAYSLSLIKKYTILNSLTIPVYKG